MVPVSAELLARAMNVLIHLNEVYPPSKTLRKLIDGLSEALKERPTP